MHPSSHPPLPPFISRQFLVFFVCRFSTSSDSPRPSFRLIQQRERTAGVECTLDEEEDERQPHFFKFACKERGKGRQPVNSERSISVFFRKNPAFPLPLLTSSPHPSRTHPHSQNKKNFLNFFGHFWYSKLPSTPPPPSPFARTTLLLHPKPL